MEYNHLLSTNDIVDLLTNLNIKLNQKGKNIFFNCPFHQDNHPSFCFEPTRKLFKCFSCQNFNQGKAGNIFQFWSSYKKKTVLEAVKEISSLGYFSFSEWQKNQESENKKEELLDKFSLLVTDIYHHNLFTENGTSTLGYLQNERKLSIELIEQFSLGCTINSKQLVKLFHFPIVEEFAFAVQQFTFLWRILENNQVVDFFVPQQVIFPLRNEQNKIISWAARQYVESDSKYIFAPNYCKSAYLYNYFQAKNDALNECYLVEGFFDVISLQGKGIKNCLGLLGTTLSERQLEILKKTNKRIVLFLDNDLAGQEATRNIVISLLLQEIDCEVVDPAGYHSDPDVLCLEKTEVVQVLTKRIPPYFYILKHYFVSLDINNNIHRIGSFIEKISFVFAKFKASVHEYLIEQISKLVSWTKEEIKKKYLSSRIYYVPSVPREFVYEDCQKVITNKEKLLIFLSLQSRRNWILIFCWNYLFNDPISRKYYRVITNHYESSQYCQHFKNSDIYEKLNNYGENEDKKFEKTEHIGNICQEISRLKAFLLNVSNESK